MDVLTASRTVIPVLTIPRASDAVLLARALVRGGIRILEVTLRTAAAAEAVALIQAEVPEAIIALGTLTTEADVALAHRLNVGLCFSPGATPALLKAARDARMTFVPGVQTASDLMMAAEFGYHVVKFFPAVPAGGLAALKALAAPFPRTRFCPTGGIDESSMQQWLSLPYVFAVGGSWLATPQDLEQCNWSAIEHKAGRVRDLLSACSR
ncbi:MAG: bifunctional 4-hydroxy-2-oxoglutarate aldolase/2-dehydro-3-deoxy-phosphogluconate aldolase [Janthinobacterium lividum]